jgi:hypothetical protein
MNKLTSTILLLFLLSGCAKSPEVFVYDVPPSRGSGLEIKVVQPDRIFIENPPQMVAGGSEAYIYEDTLKVSIDGRVVREIYVFHGLDRGDIVEMDTHIYLDGVPVFMRSVHKEVWNSFDSWESKAVGRTGRTLSINIGCRVTGVNTSVLNRLAARPHWGIWIVFE